MSCLKVTNSVSAKCRNQQPGCSTIYLINYEDVATYTLNATGDKISGLTFDAGTSGYTITAPRDSIQFSVNATINITNGTKIYVPTLSFNLPGLDTTIRNLVNSLGEATVIAFVKTVDAEIYCLGIVNGLDATTIETSSGLGPDTLKGTTITLEGRESNPYYQLESWVYAAAIAPILV